MLKILKTAVSIVIGIGTETIVSGIAKNAIKDNSSKILNVCAKVASVAVAGVITQACTDHIDKTVEETTAVFKGAMEAAKEANNG